VGEVIAIGLDLAKSVFQAHGADASGAVVFRKKLRRDQVTPFFAGQPRCLVAMEACASAHQWAREIGALGHEARLIPPAYVKPFVLSAAAWPPRQGRAIDIRLGPALRWTAGSFRKSRQ
jgi:transposase